MSVAISIDNVIKRFGKDTIINGLSLDVRPLGLRQDHAAAHDHRL